MAKNPSLNRFPLFGLFARRAALRMSAYKTARKVKLWIITEAADDHGRRVATTILLPEEY
jgi:hypothetical protein